MKLRERTKRFDFNPFPFEMHVVVTNDIKLSATRRGVDPESEMLKVSRALTLTIPGRSTIVLSRACGLQSIAHEVSHVIWSFMHYIGAEPENEFIAYYMGHYVFEVSKFVLKK